MEDWFECAKNVTPPLIKIMNRLHQTYKSSVIPELTSRFQYKNSEMVPKLTKVVLNVGAGELHSNKGTLENVVQEIERIGGQKAVATKAKKAISSFKIREGNIVGVMTTLRGERMYDFVDKLVSITIPRLRDFRGLSRKSFDGNGNYSLGFKDQTVFVEIPYESITKPHGVEISISTTARTNEEGMALLELMGFPFEKKAQE